jgi:ribonuclease VapC
MIVDTSAIIAILKPEADSPELAASIADAPSASISASTYVECGVVIARQLQEALDPQLDQLIEMLNIEIAPFTADQARLACDAYRRFGRGSGHKAQLNFGDCFSYALAVERREPLLFKGDDFAKTDIISAQL